MAKKPFEIQDSTLRMGGVDLQAGNTGVVIPGITQAVYYYAEEVDEIDANQTITFQTIPEVIDAVTFTDYSNGAPANRASYEVEELDDGYIENIRIISGGGYDNTESNFNSNNNMYVYTGSAQDHVNPFVPSDWTAIPFRPKMRAGDVETIGGGGSLGNFEAEGGELYVPNEETIQINTFNGDGVKKAHITLDPNYPLAKMAINIQRSWGFNENSDFQMGNTWSDNGSGGGVIALTGLSQYLYDTINESWKYVDKKIILNSNTYNFTGWNSGGTLGVDAYINLDTDTGPNGAPVAVSYFQITGTFENRIVFDDDEGDYGVLLDNESFKIQVGNDINLYAGDDLRLEGNDVVHLRNKGLGESVRITSQYGQGNERDWYFDHTGVLSGPGSEGSLLVYGLESKDNDLYVGINNAQPSWPAISDILTSAVSRVNFVGSISALPDVGSISFTGIQTWTQMNNVRYYYQKFDDTSISLYVDVGRTTPLDTTVFGTDYIQDTVNTYTWQQYSNNGGASNGWVDSVAYPGIVNVPLGAIVNSALGTVTNETIVTLQLSQFEGIYTIFFSGDSGTGRHQLGEDYVASWTTSGVATGSAVYTTDGYDVRLVPTTGSGTGATAGRVKVESGLLELSSGATLGGIGIIAPADDNFGIRTQFYPTVSAEAAQGTVESSAFFDTTFVDDISVVQVGWQYNTGTQLSPIWTAATQAEFVGENLFVITVPGVTFEVGNTYTFRNPSIETDTWYFNSDRSFTTPAGGKISHVNNDLKIETVGLTDVIVLRTAGGDLVINSDASLTFNDGVSTISAVDPAQSGGVGGLSVNGKDRTYIGISGNEYGYIWDFRAFGLNDETTAKPTIKFPGNGWLQEDLSNLGIGGFDVPTQLGSQGAFTLTVKDNSTFPDPASTYNWTFGTDGSLTLPGGMTVETTYGGSPTLVLDGKTHTVELRSDNTILIGFNDSSGNVYIGNPEGTGQVDIVGPKFRVFADAPTASTGAVGDQAGQIAFNGSYIYYCTADYTDGLSNIWKRVAWSGDTW